MPGLVRVKKEAHYGPFRQPQEGEDEAGGGEPEAEQLEKYAPR